MYLHSADNPKQVRRIRSHSVDIFINPNENISEEDLEFFEARENSSGENSNIIKKDETTSSAPDINSEETRKLPVCKIAPCTESPDANVKDKAITQNSFAYQKPQMRKVTFTLYPDEYEMLVNNIQENGYKKTEFLLACVTSAKKKSMESTYRKWESSRHERRLAERKARKQAELESQSAE